MATYGKVWQGEDKICDSKSNPWLWAFDASFTSKTALIFVLCRHALGAHTPTVTAKHWECLSISMHFRPNINETILIWTNLGMFVTVLFSYFCFYHRRNLVIGTGFWTSILSPFFWAGLSQMTRVWTYRILATVLVLKGRVNDQCN